MSISTRVRPRLLPRRSGLFASPESASTSPESLFTSSRNPYPHHYGILIHMPRNTHLPSASALNGIEFNFARAIGTRPCRPRDRRRRRWQCVSAERRLLRGRDLRYCPLEAADSPANKPTRDPHGSNDSGNSVRSLLTGYPNIAGSDWTGHVLCERAPRAAAFAGSHSEGQSDGLRAPAGTCIRCLEPMRAVTED